MRRRPPTTPPPGPRPIRAPLLALLAGAVVAGCGGSGGGTSDTGDDGAARAEADTASSTPGVVASIFPVAELARAIAGDAARVDVLLPPGASPATFEPTPRAIRAVSGAGLHVLVGGGLDGWARSLVEGASTAETLVLTEGMELLAGGHEEGTGNPHVWLDPILTRDHLLPSLVDALVRLAPDDEAGIRARGRALADTLTALDRELERTLAPVRGRAFVTAHPAWVYFVDRYDLLEVGTIHAQPGREPAPRALAGLVEAAGRARVRAVFAEPQMPGPAARALAEELGVELHTLDPLGGPGLEGRDSYPALLRHNARRIVLALGDERG